VQAICKTRTAAAAAAAAVVSSPFLQVACRVLQLKLLMPAANIPELLYQKPSLLLLQDIPGTITPALAKLAAIMPGIPVVRKLHEGTNAFCNFCSLLEASGSGLMKAAGSGSIER
jgi:hypothetical protein